MGVPLPSLVGEEFAGPDLTAAPPVEQIIAWLDAAADGDASDYVALWRRLADATGCTASIYWPSVWPAMMIGQAADMQEAERGRYRDALYDHLFTANRRRSLMQALLSELPSPTMPGIKDDEVARITMEAIRAFVATDGRILIDPQGRLTEGAGIPNGWGRNGEAHDAEIIRSSRAFAAATLCEKPAAQIHRFVAQYGTKTPNGWTELSKDAPIFTRSEAAFAAWKAALGTITTSGDDEEDGEEWAIVDLTEDVIMDSAERGIRIAAIRLWVNLQHSLADKEQNDCVIREDLAGLLAQRGNICWPEWPTICALDALQNAEPDHAK
jgi:hypothetical protein